MGLAPELRQDPIPNADKQKAAGAADSIRPVATSNTTLRDRAASRFIECVRRLEAQSPNRKLGTNSGIKIVECICRLDRIRRNVADGIGQIRGGGGFSHIRVDDRTTGNDIRIEIIERICRLDHIGGDGDTRRPSAVTQVVSAVQSVLSAVTPTIGNCANAGTP